MVNDVGNSEKLLEVAEAANVESARGRYLQSIVRSLVSRNQRPEEAEEAEPDEGPEAADAANADDVGLMVTSL
eukprot:NODE_6852_length_478_cov_212.356974.p2 GENE.NODE_6852_length_478_cov_212.356974~~NODE_6852_length_478_cov_212.356974.p2  ORF type:complete len:73 (-),score=20.45 NODE_6852_length_478_cov_212.356974:162-380(-)